MMKHIKDRSQFADEFQKLINSNEYSDMTIDSNEKSTVIRLEGHSNNVSPNKNDMLLKVLEETAGILKNYPKAAKELLAISSRDEEDDREDTQIG
jgi:hypothetical protein